MIQIELVVQIVVGIFLVGGGIVGFFVMQKGQNMKIEQLQKEVDILKQKQSDFSHYQIITEKDLIAINVKLDHILEAIGELKNGNT